ncbi:MAG: hypothetical protein K2W82_18275 [Candidatus Obscuribacterales bacterium]|jgi:hypothetical protein|nr:hypothetical protein [Candidatus Obscuribacterales bacterium]
MRICISLKPEDQEILVAAVLKARGYSLAVAAPVAVGYLSGSGAGHDPGEGVYATVAVTLPDGIAATLRLNRAQLIECITVGLIDRGYVDPTVAHFNYAPKIGMYSASGCKPSCSVIVKAVPGLKAVEKQSKLTKRVSTCLQLSETQIETLIYDYVCSLGYLAAEGGLFKIQLTNENGHIAGADLCLTANMLIFLPDGLLAQIYLPQGEFKTALVQALVACGYVFDPESIIYSHKAYTGVQSERETSGVRASVPVMAIPLP